MNHNLFAQYAIKIILIINIMKLHELNRFMNIVF